jgi:hypothetical protein
VKSRHSACSASAWAASKGGSSAIPGSAANASSHSISTRTRAWIRPNSEKTGRNAPTLDA